MAGKDLLDTLKRFSDTRVLVLGDVMLDEYVWGEVQRISPEAPVPVVDMQRRSYVAGGAANTAANIASLGGRAVLGGVVGADHEGKILNDVLTQAGVLPHGLLVDPGRGTTLKTRIVAQHQQVVRVDREHRGSLGENLEEDLLRWAVRQLRQVEACVLSDYGKGVVTPSFAQGVIEQANRAGKAIVVDPKGVDYRKYRSATLVKPNVHEVEKVLNRSIRTESDLVTASRELTALLAGSALLVSRGAEGMTLFREGKSPFHIPSAAQQVFDVTGAGDTVVSTLVLALAAGAPLEQAAELANRAAGIVVGKVGTAAVSVAELRRNLQAPKRTTKAPPMRLRKQ